MKNEVAERYGAGLFELAKEENKVEETDEENMEDFAE